MSVAKRSQQNGQVELVTGSEAFGTSFVSVLVKRSYSIYPNVKASRRESDHEFLKVDQYYDNGDPQTATIQFESETVPTKHATDLVVVGNAYSPQGKPQYEAAVSVSLGTRRKILRISGDRVCHHISSGLPRFSEPIPFTVMPLRYERAYGGLDERSDSKIPFRYPRNDLGKGVALGATREVIEGLALPNIEDPNDSITPERVVIGDPRRWHLQPLPQGLGWRQRTWFPRCALIGSSPPFLDVGTVTAEERMELLPQNYVTLARQFRLANNQALFANGASFGLSLNDLNGDEPVELVGLTPDGRLSFSLPDDRPTIGLDVGQGMNPLNARLLTISIRPDESELDMIWAGHHQVGEFQRWADIKRLDAEVR